MHDIFQSSAADAECSRMEPLAMYSRTDIHSVLHLIDRRSRIGGPLLIAVDGLGGAGKSTLAAQLSAALPRSSIVEVDDFYRPMTAEDRADLGPREGYERYFDWVRLLDEAIEPLRKQRRARFRRYDWEMNSLGEWCEVAPSDVVIVEGVYSTRPELRPLFGVTVYVDTPRVQRAARMTARGYDNLDWLDHWMAAEDWYVRHHRPAERADLVIDGSGERGPA